MAKKRVKFLVSPSGRYGLGYNADDVVELPAKQADEILKNGDAVLVDENGEALEQDGKDELDSLKVANEVLENNNRVLQEENEMLKKENETLKAAQSPVTDPENVSEKEAAAKAVKNAPAGQTATDKGVATAEKAVKPPVK